MILTASRDKTIFVWQLTREDVSTYITIITRAKCEAERVSERMVEQTRLARTNNLVPIQHGL